MKYHDTELIFDPQKNKHLQNNIFITHAHNDHSRGFSFREPEKVSTKATKEIVEFYSKKVQHWKSLSINERVWINDLEVVSHNAGHVLGSSLYEIITPEGNIVYTGDFQFTDSFTMKSAEPVSCDILIIESTFGTPNFVFPKRPVIAQDMVKWSQKIINEGKVPTFKADSLGNAQEVTKVFNMYTKLPVIVHWKIAQFNEYYRANGVDLSFSNSRSEEASEIIRSGECVVIMPKRVKLLDYPEPETALVSGWALWIKDKKAFALSDHADFSQLMEFVKACNPRAILTCFGNKFNTIFADQVEKRLKIEARPLNLIPSKFLPEHQKFKVKSCMDEILKSLRMPGFIYPKNWIIEEIKALNFSEIEIEEALDRLTRRGLLKTSHSK